jgi:hypothetical protein
MISSVYSSAYMPCVYCSPGGVVPGQCRTKSTVWRVGRQEDYWKGVIRPRAISIILRSRWCEQRVTCSDIGDLV